MSRLARDRAGSTLAMMGAFLLPVCVLAGSAVDVARMYVVKVRLQQACDAGVLAGRKFMVSSASPTLDANATAQAKTFFANNFSSGFMSTPTFDSTTNPYPFVPSKTVDQQVAGTASVSVPMTVMKMFQAPNQTISVTCEARFDVADTDIIFVLDTTGSMACTPEETDSQCTSNNPAAVTYTRPAANTGGVAGYAGSTGYRVPERTSGGTNVSRIQALRTAVVDFYNTMATNVDPSTNIRYGFVTYSSMVNAGKAIMDVSPDYIVGGTGSGTWRYQSRSPVDYVKSNGSWSDVSGGLTQTQCNAQVPVRTPAMTANSGYNASYEATITQYGWNSSKCQMRTNTLGPTWTYQPVDYEVGPYVAGGAVLDPSKKNGSTAQWWGCIEERQTTAGQTSFNINSLPPDLDPDLVPTSDATRWRPFWPDVEYYRSAYNSYPSSNGENASNWNYPTRLASGYTTCGKPVQRLKTMSATDVSNYVNAPDFVPLGGTYHDTGMIWGVRLLSPTGIFANDTAAWPGRQPPKRVIVFLTDGQMAPNQDIYGFYGSERMDRRVMGGGTSPTLTSVHNSRFLAECSKAKSMNIDVWTVGIDDAADANLTSCATVPEQAFHTTSGTGLSTYFQKIAKQIAMLRISQ